MLTTQEYILTYLLNCGTEDLPMLEDINYDLDDILDELVETGRLSLNNIFEGVFRKGISELTDIVIYCKATAVLSGEKVFKNVWINWEILTRKTT